MGTAPFTDANEVEVCARVALQLVKREYRLSDKSISAAPALIRAALTRLGKWDCPVLTLALLSLQDAVLMRGQNSEQWLALTVLASRTPMNFRQCFFPEYKATRRRAISRRSR